MVLADRGLVVWLECGFLIVGMSRDGFPTFSPSSGDEWASDQTSSSFQYFFMKQAGNGHKGGCRIQDWVAKDLATKVSWAAKGLAALGHRRPVLWSFSPLVRF